jgi:hypothetical protein
MSEKAEKVFTSFVACGHAHCTETPQTIPEEKDENQTASLSKE